MILSSGTDVRNRITFDPAGITLEGEPDPQLDQQAGEFVKSILIFNPNDPTHMDLRGRNTAAVEQLGSKTQQEAAHRSAMLKEPIRKLGARGEDGGEVANALVDLKMQVESLDPGRFDFKAGWATRTLGWLPGVGTPLKKFFSRFESPGSGPVCFPPIDAFPCDSVSIHPSKALHCAKQEHPSRTRSVFRAPRVRS